MNKIKMYKVLETIMIMYYSMWIPFGVEYMIGTGIGILILLFSRNFKISINRTFILVIFFSISFFSLQSFLEYGFLRSFAYSLTIIIMYLCGYNWIDVYQSSNETSQCVKYTIKIIYIGIALYVLMCVVYTYLTGNVLSVFNRDPKIFWDGSEGNSTHFSSISAVPLAASAYFSMSENKKERFFNISVFLCTLLCNLLMSNRISVIFAGIFILLALYLKYKDSLLKTKTKIIMLIVALLTLCAITYSFNLFNIQSRIMSLPMIKRTVALNQQGYKDPRLERQLYVLKNFTKHMFGGGYFNYEIGEVHNVWLDVYDYAGIIPFIFFVALTISILVKMFKVLNISKYDETIKILLMVLFAYLLSFVEEPVIRSCESYMVLFFFCCGLFYRYIKMIKV